jgi:hypothetical protein
MPCCAIGAADSRPLSVRRDEESDFKKTWSVKEMTKWGN